jgi:hypothetical protein
MHRHEDGFRGFKPDGDVQRTPFPFTCGLACVGRVSIHRGCPNTSHAAHGPSRLLFIAHLFTDHSYRADIGGDMMLAVFALLASLIASVSATLTNISVTDNSPTIKYTPSRSGDSYQTWNVSYTGNAWSTTSFGNISQGTSQHLTYYIGATATFGFRGTAIYINGSATGDDAEVTVGGEVITPRGLPASKEGMKDQWWDVVVKVNGNRGVSLYGITFTVDIGNDGRVLKWRGRSELMNSASLSTRTIPALNEQNGLNPDLSFSGQWGARTAVGSESISLR